MTVSMTIDPAGEDKCPACGRDLGAPAQPKRTMELQWKPIVSAPRDGTYILIWHVGINSAVVGSWRKPEGKPNGREHWRPYPSSNFDDRELLAAQHWMPLPAAPELPAREVEAGKPGQPEGAGTADLFRDDSSTSFPPHDSLSVKDVLASVRGIHAALDDALGDTDVTHMEDDELRDRYPVQWAAERLTEVQWWLEHFTEPHSQEASVATDAELAKFIDGFDAGCEIADPKTIDRMARAILAKYDVRAKQ